MAMLRLWLGLLVAGLLASCGGASSAPSALVEPNLLGTVDILTPTTGWLVYSETLTITGTAQGLGAQGFRLRLLTAEGETLAQPLIHPTSETWQTTLVHGYQGEPTELTLLAESSTSLNSLAEAYDIETLAIAGRQYRPEPAVFGGFVGLNDGQVLGGEQILLTGTLSGVLQGEASLRFIVEGETKLEQIIALPSASVLDESVWSADLPTQDITGPVTVELVVMRDSVAQVLDSLDLMLSMVAG
jgi:hypothetical protein